MRVIVRVIALLWGGFVLAASLGTIAAAAAKRRIVPTEDPEADEVRVAAIFEPMTFHTTAGSFRGGTVDCWYGGGVIDLRDAVLDPAGARLRVRAVFGGGQILVPESWRVSASVFGIGGLGDARSRVERAADAPHLAIEGIAIFGGFAVMSEMSEAEARGLSRASTRWGRRHGARTRPEAQPSA